VPPLSETYVHPAYGHTLRYPSGWHVGKGWQGLLGWQEMPTLTSYPPDAAPPDLGVFGGHALIAVQVVQVPAGDMETLLDQVLASTLVLSVALQPFSPYLVPQRQELRVPSNENGT
jgi:hypothetical protein